MKSKTTIISLWAICLISFFGSCKQAAKSTLKKGIKETTTEVAKESAEKGTKMAIRSTAHLTMETLPKGRKALAVVKNEEGRLVPAIDNLNAKAVNYSADINKLLLKTRRMAISPYDQFPTLAQLKNYDIKKLILTDKPNADILRKNMYLTMDKKSVEICQGFGGTAAHHVIEGSDKAAVESRAILKKFGIDINAPENGILLPDGKNSIYKGCMHRTSHTPEYSQYVYNRIKDVKSKEELIATLTEIKYELYTGKLNLQGPRQAIKRGTAQQISRTPIDQGIKISEASSSRLVNIGSKKNIPIEKVIPYGNGGINAEKRTLLEICKNPVPSYLFKNIDNI